MSETIMMLNQADEALLALDVSDHALEMAANSGLEGRGAYTIIFCTGLDSCPAVPALRRRAPECRGLTSVRVCNSSGSLAMLAVLRRASLPNCCGALWSRLAHFDRPGRSPVRSLLGVKPTMPRAWPKRRGYIRKRRAAHERTISKEQAESWIKAQQRTP